MSDVKRDRSQKLTGNRLMAHIHRILCASDFSKASGPAFATAVTMAKSNRATLTILHVFVPAAPLFPDAFVASATWEELDAR
jgi:nucleotide-binding universal stress UspA family protein